MLSVQSWHHRFKQQARWTVESRNYLYQRFDLCSCRQILEVGCGTGVIIQDLCDRTPARVHGLDILVDRLNFAKCINADAYFSCADALHLPYINRVFDLTLCHFLLLWLRASSMCLAEMLRVTRPGGIIAALAEPDYGGRIDHPDSMASLGKLQTHSLITQGADPFIGRRLSEIFHNAGLVNVNVGLLGGHWPEPPKNEDIDSEWEVLQADLGEAVTNDQLESLRRQEAEAWQSGSRILFVPTFYAWGRVPD